MSQKAPFWANDLHNSAPRLNSVCSVTIPCALRAGERGLLWGRCPPSRPLSKPPNHPPYIALSLSVRCPPVPTKASLSEQAGAYIHPRMGGGMKSGQGDYPSCVPRPAVGGIAGGCMSEEVALRYFFVLFQFVPTPSPAPSGRGKGACYGGVAPLRGPFPNPRITPRTSR